MTYLNLNGIMLTRPCNVDINRRTVRLRRVMATIVPRKTTASDLLIALKSKMQVAVPDSKFNDAW